MRQKAWLSCLKNIMKGITKGCSGCDLSYRWIGSMKKIKNCPTVLTKDMSSMLKGIAILMMLAHHLWGFPDRMQGNSIPSICVQIGEAFKMCVTIFLFLSGNGLYITYKKRGCLETTRRVWNTYKKFWRIFFVFIPVGLLFFRMSFHWGEFFGNMFCLTYSYNHEWWFLGTYIELLIVLSFFLRFEKIRGFAMLLIASSIVFRILSETIFVKSGGVVICLISVIIMGHLCLECYLQNILYMSIL